MLREYTVSMNEASHSETKSFSKLSTRFFVHSFIHCLNQINFTAGKIHCTVHIWINALVMWSSHCEHKKQEEQNNNSRCGSGNGGTSSNWCERMCCMIYYFIQITKGTHFESHMNIIKRHFNYRSPPPFSKRSQFALVPIDLWMMQTTNIGVNHFSRIFFKLSFFHALCSAAPSPSLASSVFIHRSVQIDCWEIWRML